MPRSKRRKGVKADKATQTRRGFIDGTAPKRYYDPGKHPKPRKPVGAVAPRHDHRRGS